MIDRLKRKYIVVAIAALIGVEAVGAWWQYHRAIVVIRNESGQDISVIRIAVRDDKHEIEYLAAEAAHRIRVFPPGESGVSLSFKTADGKSFNWDGGYIEATGGYRMTIAIQSRGEVSEKTRLRRGFLLGPVIGLGRNR